MGLGILELERLRRIECTLERAMRARVAYEAWRERRPVGARPRLDMQLPKLFAVSSSNEPRLIAA